MPPTSTTTSTSPWSETLPGGAPVYDPTNPNPLGTPPASASDASGMPPPLTPPPPRVDPDRKVQAPSFLVPHTSAAKFGSIATMADAILTGVMQGKDKAAQMKAYKANRLMNGLRGAYQSAEQKYLDLIRSGADPNSKDVQDAKAQADASWTAMMQMYDNYLGDGKGDKKGKKGKGGGGVGEQPNPLQVLTDPNAEPQAKIGAWRMIAAKMGAPYQYKAAPYLTPEYRKQLELGRGQQQVEGDITQKRLDLHRLQNMDVAQMSDADKQKLERLQNDPELFPQLARETPHYSTSDIPGASLANAKDELGNPVRDKFGQPIDPKQNYRIETIGGKQTYVPSVPRQTPDKLGSPADFMKRVANEAGINPNDLSAQSVLDLNNAYREAQQVGKVIGRKYVYTDKTTGDIHAIDLVTKTEAPHATVPAIKGGGSSAAPSAAAPSAAVAPPTVNHPKHGPVRDLPAPGQAASATSGARGDQIIGHTQSAAGAKTQQVVADTYKKQKTLIDLLGAQEDYMAKIDKGEAPTPRQDLALIVAAVRAMNPGSVRLPTKELELELKAGSWGDRARRYYDNAAAGTLPDDQRRDLFTIVKNETTKAGESIAADWQQYMTGKPLPEDLKRFAKGGGGGAGSAKTTSKSHIAAYAAAKGITESQAEQEFKSAGYTIQ